MSNGTVIEHSIWIPGEGGRSRLAAVTRTSQAAGDGELVRLGEAVGHLVRVGILRSLASADEPMSPKDLAGDLGVAVASTAYHVERLERLAVVKLASTATRRAAVEHYYRLTATGRRIVKAAGVR